MDTLQFATKGPHFCTRGCGGNTNSMESSLNRAIQSNGPNSSTEMETDIRYTNNHFEYMPAVLLNSLKRDKKPFTYTPGRMDLSEVLNDKLQKRMERRKKQSIDKSHSQSLVNELPVFESPKQVLVMPTYNSPLSMYSMENALEALEVQAEITVADKSNQSMTLPRNYKFESKDFEPKNVTQSKAFRVLQIMTDTEEEAEEQAEPKRNKHHQEEMQFSGLRESKEIPSKYFHQLQKIAGVQEENFSNVVNHEDAGFQKETYSKICEPVMTGNSVSNFTRFNHSSTHMEENKSSPVLRRPAAFLPAKHCTVPSSTYFSVIGKSNTQSMIHPYEGTDF